MCCSWDDLIASDKGLFTFFHRKLKSPNNLRSFQLLIEFDRFMHVKKKQHKQYFNTVCCFKTQNSTLSNMNAHLFSLPTYSWHASKKWNLRLDKSNKLQLDSHPTYNWTVSLEHVWKWRKMVRLNLKFRKEPKDWNNSFKKRSCSIRVSGLRYCLNVKASPQAWWAISVALLFVFHSTKTLQMPSLWRWTFHQINCALQELINCVYQWFLLPHCFSLNSTNKHTSCSWSSCFNLWDCLILLEQTF